MVLPSIYLRLAAKLSIEARLAHTLQLESSRQTISSGSSANRKLSDFRGGISPVKSACRKSSIASDSEPISEHILSRAPRHALRSGHRRCCGRAACQFGWSRGNRNLLGQNSFWLQRPDTDRIDNYSRSNFAANLSIPPCAHRIQNDLRRSFEFSRGFQGQLARRARGLEVRTATSAWVVRT